MERGRAQAKSGERASVSRSYLFSLPDYFPNGAALLVDACDLFGKKSGGNVDFWVVCLVLGNAIVFPILCLPLESVARETLGNVRAFPFRIYLVRSNRFVLRLCGDSVGLAEMIFVGGPPPNQSDETKIQRNHPCG